MLSIFSEESRLEHLLQVEAALARAHSKLGTIPTKDAKVITQKANLKYVTLNEVKKIEAETKLAQLDLIHTEWSRRKLTQQAEITQLPSMVKGYENDIELLEKDIKIRDAILKKNKEGKEYSELHLRT